MQAFNNGQITSEKIFITPELVASFRINWNKLVITNHNCLISYPFYFLKSEPFWKLIPKLGFFNLNDITSLVKSFARLNAAVDYAEIDQDLFVLMENEKTNAVLQQYLLDEYFPSTKNRFNNSIEQQLNLFNRIEDKILNEDAAVYAQEIKILIKENEEEEIFLRGSLFKREIPKIYNNTCSISGMRIDALINISMIDACHIKPFSVSYDDTITNGIALCPNLHRAFDRGLIAIDDNFKMMVSDGFTESENNYSIKAFAGKEIALPSNIAYYPLNENFRWHVENVFWG